MVDLNTLLQQSIQAHESGDLITAANGYATVLQAAPELPDVWHLAGLVAHQSGCSENGIKCIEQAISLRDDAEYFADLAGIYQSLGNSPEAERNASKAIDLEPGLGAAHYRRGVALAKLSRIEEALQHLQIALETDFSTETTLLDIGLILQSAGDISTATRAYEISLELNPHQANIYHRLAKLALAGDYELSEAQLDRMETIVQTFDSVPSFADQAASFHFCLGEHFERNNQYSLAFSHYQIGNEQLSKGSKNQARSDDDDFRYRARRMADFFSIERLQNSAVPSQSRRQPIFVIGLPHSGTKLVRQILESHPEISGSQTQGALPRALKDFQELWQSDHSGLDFGRSEAGQVAENYWAHLNPADPLAARTIDSSGNLALCVGFIRMAFPSATIFWCRRDPRDLALANFASMAESEGDHLQPTSPERMAKSIVQHDNLMHHWNQKGIQLVPVYFERMLTSPEQETRRLISAAEMTWSDSCLEPFAADANPATPNELHVDRRVSQSAMGRWENFSDHLQPLAAILEAEIAAYEAVLFQAD